MRLRVCSQHKIFPFFVDDSKDSEGFREDGRIQGGLYSDRMKRFRETYTTSNSWQGVPAYENKQQRCFFGL